ncbi:cytidine deaminase [Volvox carteri f. nagariensis]|uniref:Cytidine deaminase n=1 Tax=Volvox carteri f. nagariensis TaxID=3068 RepID=D8TRZ8_VOLCA|nr:cytidine deaminase [Volvox carteri f. nagariensis]EFJ49738.1 cytidine deaminase [Volvox carteri f. nagariensis]|eukprot:XP_002949245.1 cytidine deaminase [Volvox carteri f. nagariensis]
MQALRPLMHLHAAHVRTNAVSKRPAARGAAPVTTQQYLTEAQVAMDDMSPLKGRFMIPAAEVRQLLNASGNTVEELLFSLITPASKLARPPISGYRVGSVALGGSGSVYVGVNIEFPGAPLNNSIHAEQCLLVNCLHSGETSMQALAVSAAPCGHCSCCCCCCCWAPLRVSEAASSSLDALLMFFASLQRQFYAEIKDADALEYIFGRDTQPKFLADLLPERFGPSDLQSRSQSVPVIVHAGRLQRVLVCWWPQVEPFPLLLERQSNSAVWHQDALAEVAERAGEQEFQRAAALALSEARQCYAPYTKCHSGAAVVTRSGQVFSGGYIESAAYNPSLSPFHSAVVDAVTHLGLPSYDQPTGVVGSRVGGVRMCSAVGKSRQPALLVLLHHPAVLLTLPRNNSCSASYCRFHFCHYTA